MVDDGTLGGIPTVTKRKRVLFAQGKHVSNRGVRTKDGNIISEEKRVKGDRGR